MSWVVAAGGWSLVVVDSSWDIVRNTGYRVERPFIPEDGHTLHRYGTVVGYFTRRYDAIVEGARLAWGEALKEER